MIRLAGSILESLIFLLYTNIINVSDKLLPALFADDTNLFISGNDMDSMILTMNEQYNKFIEWLSFNKLSLNVKKTHVIFKPGQKFVLPTEHLKVNNGVIGWEETTTFLPS